MAREAADADEEAESAVVEAQKRLQGLREKELAAAQSEAALNEQKWQVMSQQNTVAEQSEAADGRQADLDTRRQQLAAEQQALLEHQVCTSCRLHLSLQFSVCVVLPELAGLNLLSKLLQCAEL